MTQGRNRPVIKGSFDSAPLHSGWRPPPTSHPERSGNAAESNGSPNHNVTYENGDPSTPLCSVQDDARWGKGGRFVNRPYGVKRGLAQRKQPLRAVGGVFMNWRIGEMFASQTRYIFQMRYTASRREMIWIPYKRAAGTQKPFSTLYAERLKNILIFMYFI